MKHYDIAIVGSGFAGSILARALKACGRSVVMIERARHPRFALGESSTPLAALSLERLAARYRLPDLIDLSAWGRWTARLPELERGLKRGFTFFAHRSGELLEKDSIDDRRLLVAASPNDRVADCHWLRSKVDWHLAGRARHEGVDLLETTVATALERVGEDWLISIRPTGDPVRVNEPILASFIVDASGPNGFLADQLDLGPIESPSRLDTALLFQHFRGVRPLAEVLAFELSPGPYPDERAAVHHLLDEGWMYLLPFDHGVVSAGIELDRSQDDWLALARRDPKAAFDGIVARYPTLAAQFEGAEALRRDVFDQDSAHRFDGPIGFRDRLQFRAELPRRTAADRWLLLPHAYAFSSPLFSTGLAWSLLAVERAADLLGTSGEPWAAPDAEALRRYDDLLEREAEWLDRLIAGAFRATSSAHSDFDRFVAWALFYFAAASYEESKQRLRPDDHDWRWSAFLGADDTLLESILSETEQVAHTMNGKQLRRQITERFAPRDVAGLAQRDPSTPPNLYPVDLNALVESASKLGLSSNEIRVALPKLRGESSN